MPVAKRKASARDAPGCRRHPSRSSSLPGDGLGERDELRDRLAGDDGGTTISEGMRVIIVIGTKSLSAS